MGRITEPAWRRVWRKGVAPQLPTEGLLELRRALAVDDPTLLQGATTSPPPLQAVQDWPVEAADAIAFCGWKTGREKVVDAEIFFAKVCFEADQRVGEAAACRHWLNWFDNTPRAEMRELLLAEVDAVLAERLGFTHPAITADWLRDQGRDAEAGCLCLEFKR